MSTRQPAALLLDKGDGVVSGATNLLKAMANENRLRILCLLDEGELSVSS